ncbi:MAG: TIR domain-containing protein [Candidatus Cryptobacteroides sp.]
MEYRYDVFISYSSKDQKVVEGICAYLEQHRIRCFVAYRDIPAGVVYAKAIVDGLDYSRMMLVVFSDSFNRSEQVDREIELASEDHKPILTFRITDDAFQGAKKYYLKNLNWIDAFPNPERSFGPLLTNICRLLGVEEPAKTTRDTADNNDRLQPGYVDLGLSVKWADCNLGATKPEEYGGYYQWAGTEDVAEKSIYLDWSNCPYHTGSSYERGWTKYNTQLFYGTVDNKTTLEASDDAAAVTLGGKWRMPTDAEWTELREKCSWTWTTLNGVKGFKVQSKKPGYTDNWIFLPAAGYRYYGYLGNVGSFGFYWSSSRNMDYPYCAYVVYFYSVGVRKGSGGRLRFYGQSVRPVTE